MNTYLVTRPANNWCQDYAMVVIASDEKHAEKKARLTSDDFRKCHDINVELVDLNEERVILIANTGA